MSRAPGPVSQTPGVPSRFESVSNQTSMVVGVLLFIRSPVSWTLFPFESRYMYCAVAGRARAADPTTARARIRFRALWIVRGVAIMVHVPYKEIDIRCTHNAVVVEVEPIADRTRNAEAPHDSTKVGRRDSLAFVGVDAQPLHDVE